MEFRRFGNKYVVRLDKGEEIVDTLKKFCRDNNISLGTISGIGAVNKAVIGLFDTRKKRFRSRELLGDHEITGLTGNVSTMDGEVYLHLHINLADAQQNVRGGHLSSAVISGTGELLVESIEGTVDRKFSEEIGLNLYQF